MSALMKRGIPVLVAFWLAASTSFAAQIGAETLLPASPDPAHRPHVSYGPSAGSGQGNGQYLVVWQSGLAEKADIYGCRLSAEGKPLDNQPFVISKAVECQEYPRAAWGKDSWLVVWSDLRNDKDFDVYAARVSAKGKVLDSEGILLAGGKHNQCKPDAAWGKDSWLVAWRSYELTPNAWPAPHPTVKLNRYLARGARVASDGKVRDAKPIGIASMLKHGSSVTEPRVVSTGSGWLVAWMGTALITGQGQWFRRGVYTTVVTAEGQATPVDTFDGRGPRGPATIASNGKDGCLIAWNNHGTGGRSGPGETDHALRTDFQGKDLGHLLLSSGTRKRIPIRQSAAAWDGKGYLVVCWDGGRGRSGPRTVFFSRIRGHLVSGDGMYEGAVEVSSGKPNPAYFPAAAGNGKGKTLVVYERHPAKPGDTILIAARVVSR